MHITIDLHLTEKSCNTTRQENGCVEPVSGFTNGDICASAAVVSLRGNDLEVMLTKCHVVPAPCVEMIACRDGAARAFVLTHTEMPSQNGAS